MSHYEARSAKEATTNRQQTLVTVFYYCSTIDKVLQIWEHTRLLSNVAEELTKDRKDEVAVSVQYQTYKQPFLDMLSQLESVWDGHLGCVTMVKHPIEC